MIRRGVYDEAGEIANSECDLALGLHEIEFGGHPVMVNDGQGIDVGDVEFGGGRAVYVTVLRLPDKLPHGMALVYTMNPEEARRLAASLIAKADKLEAEAATQAAAALARAAGKGGA